MALPAALAACIDYRPALPPDRSQLMQRMPHGNVIKSVAVYDQPWWRAEGLSGQAASDEGVVSATYDSTPPAGSPGVLTAFVEGRRAQQLSRLSFKDRRETIVGCLERFFGPRARNTCGWHELDWSAEEWSRGCYGAHLPPGVWTQYGPALRVPVGPMHWAGSETAMRWPGYMDGAVASGECVAAEILRQLPPAGIGRCPADR
jgi:monoamine oxidase